MGTIRPVMCSKCRGDLLRPFALCVSIPDFAGGACGNCQWRHRQSECTFSLMHGSQPALGAGQSSRTKIPQVPSEARGHGLRSRSELSPPLPLGELRLRRSTSKGSVVVRQSPRPGATAPGNNRSLASTSGQANVDDSDVLGHLDDELSTPLVGDHSSANAAERGENSGQLPEGSPSYDSRAENLPGRVPSSYAELRQLDSQLRPESTQDSETLSWPSSSNDSGPIMDRRQLAADHERGLREMDRIRREEDWSLRDDDDLRSSGRDRSGRFTKGHASAKRGRGGRR